MKPSIQELAIQSIIAETSVSSHIVESHQYNASDPFNLCLNYAYGVIEGYVRRAVNIVGLEPSVGFLHEFSGSQTKESLVYDLQEPFRWIGDVTTIEAFESSVLDMKDFYFTGDDYRYHIEIEAKRRFLQSLKDRFNSGVKHNGKTWKWDTIILGKTQELSRFLSGKNVSLDFSDPAPSLRRSDTAEIRRRILELTQSEAGKLGIGKSTLHHLRKNADRNQPFRIYKPTIRKLVASQECSLTRQEL
jgi:CRISPR-associated protein Cas1